jgi:hypothetical protein
MKSFGIVNPEGKLADLTFFTNRKDAITYALRLLSVKSRKSDRDGSRLDWKRLKREGWAVAPVKHTVLS